MQYDTKHTTTMFYWFVASPWTTRSFCHPHQNIFNLSHAKIPAGTCVCTESKKKKIAKDGGEQRDSEETKWHEACSASVKSDWRADGPTGEDVVLLSVRLEYWYAATAALPNQAKPPYLFRTSPHHAQPENMCRHNTGCCRQNCMRYKSRCIPTLQKRVHSELNLQQERHSEELKTCLENVLKLFIIYK